MPIETEFTRHYSCDHHGCGVRMTIEPGAHISAIPFESFLIQPPRHQQLQALCLCSAHAKPFCQVLEQYGVKFAPVAPAFEPGTEIP